MSIVASISRSQPAAIREALDRRPGLKTLIMNAAIRDRSWLIRVGAIAVVGAIGRGDEATVGALLEAATDTQTVADSALEASRLIESVDEEGFAKLLSAIRSERPSDATTAADLLASLAQANALNDDQRRRTVEELQEAARAPAARLRAYREVPGIIVDAGSVGEAMSSALTVLAAGRGSAAGGAVGGRPIDVATQGGGWERLAISEGVLPQDPLEFQRRVRSGGDELDATCTFAIERLAKLCKSYDRLEAAIRFLQDQPEEPEPTEPTEGAGIVAVSD